MSDTPISRPALRRAPVQRLVLTTAAIGAGLAAAAAIVLWAYYGTAVFFETISAGLAACF